MTSHVSSGKDRDPFPDMFRRAAALLRAKQRGDDRIGLDETAESKDEQAQGESSDAEGKIAMWCKLVRKQEFQNRAELLAFLESPPPQALSSTWAGSMGLPLALMGPVLQVQKADAPARRPSGSVPRRPCRCQLDRYPPGRRRQRRQRETVQFRCYRSRRNIGRDKTTAVEEEHAEGPRNGVSAGRERHRFLHRSTNPRRQASETTHKRVLVRGTRGRRARLSRSESAPRRSNRASFAMGRCMRAAAATAGV